MDDFGLPDLVPLSTGLFPQSVAQAFALPSLGGPSRAVNPPLAQPSSHLTYSQVYNQQPLQQASFGNPNPQASVSGGAFPVYVSIPQGMHPPYASALPSVFGPSAFGHLGIHGQGFGYSSFSLSEGAPTGSGQPGVRVGSGPTQSMTETDDDDELGDRPPRAVKRARLVWTPQLHKRFEEAVTKLGPEKSIPKNIMQEMNVEGLTRENVASHLQKYRLQKRVSTDGPAAPAAASAAAPAAAPAAVPPAGQCNEAQPQASGIVA